MHNLVYGWLPLDVVLTGDPSGTLDEIENPTLPNALNWIMRLPLRDRWISAHGSPVFQEAFNMLRQEPRYQQALRRYGIDAETLAEIQVNAHVLLN
jgi:hypothetical protein